MNGRASLVLALVGALGLGTWLFVRLRATDLTITFTREDLQTRVAAKFPVDQRPVPLVTVTYSNPVVKLDDGSDRIGVGLDATVKLAGNELVKGRVEGDWQVRYDPKAGALYFDEPKIAKFDVKGLPSAVQGPVDSVAKPLIQEYLRRVPVYRLKPGELRQDLARRVLKSVTVKNGRLIVVVGAG